MRRNSLSWLMLVLLLWCGVRAQSVHAQDTTGLVIAADQTVRGDVSTINQPITVLGSVKGDVTSWNGTITIEGIVEGDVVTYTGAVVLGQNAYVQGNVLVPTGNIIQPAVAQVDGQVVGDDPLEIGGTLTSITAVFGQTPRGELPNPQALVGSIALFGQIGLSICVLLIWPRRLHEAGQTLWSRPWRSIVVGLLTTVLLGSVFALLALATTLSLIGIPLVLPMLFLVHLPLVVGFATLAQALTRRVGSTLRIGRWNTLIGILVISLGVGLVSVVSALAGLGLFYTLASSGLGAAVLSRGGVFAPLRIPANAATH